MTTGSPFLRDLNVNEASLQAANCAEKRGTQNGTIQQTSKLS